VKNYIIFSNSEKIHKNTLIYVEYDTIKEILGSQWDPLVNEYFFQNKIRNSAKNSIISIFLN